MVRAPQAIQWSCWRTNTVRRTRPTPEGEARNGMQPGGAVRWCFFHQILWKSYGNSMEIYESRRVPWHFHRLPYVFQTLRENMWECHGLFLLSKSREKRGGSEATNMLGRHQKLWHWWSWDAMSPRMQLWKVSGSHGVSPSYWLLPPNYVALSIPKNKNSKARWSNSMCSTFVHEIEQVE